MPRAAKKLESKSTVDLFDVLEIDKKYPVPISFGGPALTTIGGSQYHPFFAPLDNTFRSLLEARLLSPTQGECIKDKVFYSVGAGLQVKDQDFPKEFDNRINNKRQTLDDVLISAFNGYYQDGNKFIEIARTTVGKKKYVHVYPRTNLDCRFEARDDGGDPTNVMVSKSFRRDGLVTFTDQDKIVKIPLWSDEPGAKCWKKIGDSERTMLHIKNEIDGSDYYGIPSNFNGLFNVIMEWKMTSFNLDNFDNNMFLAGLLFIQGNMTEVEKKKFLRDLKKMYTGEGKGMRILPMTTEGGVQDTKFVPFNDTKEGHFIELDQNNVNKIISANSWSKDLLDIKESSGLGKSGSYLRDLFRIKFQTVISPAQQIVLNNFIFPLMQIIDEWKGSHFYDLPWYVKPVIPVSMESDLDVNSLLTVDEGREEIGKGPLGNATGKKMISEVAVKKMDPKQKGDNK